MRLLDLLGFRNKSKKISEFVQNGAVIIDVRSTAEYSGGHIIGSKNFPLETILSKIDAIKEYNKPVIACCASGIRSALATKTLKSYGITALNGGSWNSLKWKI